MGKIKKISIIGAGSWGTTLAVLLSEKGYNVNLWCRRKELADKINKTRVNNQYLKDIKIPANVFATSSKPDVSGSDIVIFAVPSDFMRSTIKSFSDYIDKDTIVVHVTKGMESTGKLMSQLFDEELPEIKNISVLSGPNHAEEVSKKLPTATVIASKNNNMAKFLCSVFSTQSFKVYPHDDVAGVEICSTVKNVIAIAIGVCDGLNFGDNAKASILTLGLSEMSKIATQFGAKRATCFGLAGVGDLIVTCYSKHSRNRHLGEMLAKGKDKEQIKKEMHGMVAEGIKNTKIIYGFCKKNNLNTPLITQTYKVLYKGMDLKSAIEQLLNMV